MTDLQESCSRLELIVCPNHGAQTCGCYQCDDWKIIEVVPRSEAEALAEALEAITRDDCMLSHGETGSWIDTDAPARIAENALAEFRASYPREFADGATVQGAANPAQTPREERAACGRCGGQVVNPGRHGEGQCIDMREETP